MPEAGGGRAAGRHFPCEWLCNPYNVRVMIFLEKFYSLLLLGHHEEKDKLWLYVPLCFLLNVIVWYKVVVGCYLTLLKGAWS